MKPERSLARTVALTTGALLVGRGLSLLAGIATVTITSRYLGTQDFGALTAAMAYASLFAVLTDLGMSTVATREIARAPEREREIVGNVVSVGLLVSLAAGGIGLALMLLVYPGHIHAATREAIVILMVQVLAAPVIGATRARFTARQRGYVVALGDVALAIGMAGLTAIAAGAHLGFRLLVAGVTGGYVLQALAMAALALREDGLSMSYHRATAARLIRSALPLGGTLLINYLYFRLDVLLLSWIKTDVDVAHYGLAYRVLEGLMVLPGYVMLALFPEIARSQDDRARLGYTVGAALGVLEALSLPAVALLATFSSEIVVLLGTHAYDASGPVLAILALALGLSYLNGVYGNALVALGRQRFVFWLALPTLVINLIANLLLIPPYGAAGAAWAVVISEVIALAIVRAGYVRVAGRPPAPPHLRILGAGTVLGALAAIKFGLSPQIGDLALVLGGGALGLVLYAALILLLRALPESVLVRIPQLKLAR